MFKFLINFFCISLFCVACQSKAISQKYTTPKIKEDFLTERNELDNVDSPTVWHGKNGENWLLTTAKETDKILIYDAENGKFLKEFGKEGKTLGELDRPNGIVVAKDFLFIVERNNKRVQVLSLPQLKPIGFVGENILKKPYGITFYNEGEKIILFVTDNYETPQETIPPREELGKRVKKFELKFINGKLESKLVKSFGETQGNGILTKVESIFVDKNYNRLLVADEFEKQKNIKIYTLDGDFTGKVIGNGIFKFEPEGIALYECDEENGFWFTTDQDDFKNTFYIFDRKTLELKSSFAGEIIANTDGISLTQKSFGKFSKGVFYAVHDDGNIGAISLKTIFERIELSTNCK